MDPQVFTALVHLTKGGSVVYYSFYLWCMYLRPISNECCTWRNIEIYVCAWVGAKLRGHYQVQSANCFLNVLVIVVKISLAI